MDDLQRGPKIRLPFIHYRPALPEILQAVLMVAVGFSATPVLQEYLGMSYGEALTAVAIAEALGMLHVTLGDPVVPGWIASALPLVLVYLGKTEAGIESAQALIALQLIVGVLFIVLGVTGLAKRLMKIIPGSIKAGILLGAAISALARVFGGGGYLSQYPWSIGVGGAVTLLMLFSKGYKVLTERHGLLRSLAKYGMLPGLLAAMAVGFISGELHLPSIQWGLIPFSFKSLFTDYSVFSIGLPSWQMFLKAAPMALAVYVIAFGEIVTAEAVLSEAQVARPDENINFKVGRTNVIAGIRNVVLALFAPFPALAGPLWAAVSVSICERYKEGKKAMGSLFSGVGSFKLTTALCVLLLPLASLLEPILPVALAITLLVQGYACSYIAIEQVKGDKTAAGVAGITGAVSYLADINWGLGVGVLLALMLQAVPKMKTISIFLFRRKKNMNIKAEKLVITVDQQTAAGGGEIAKALAIKMGVPCYETEILDEASELSGISEKLFYRYDEKMIRAAYDLTAEDEASIKLPNAGMMVGAQKDAARLLADKGPCVIVDRHATSALHGRENCISIFIHRDSDERIARFAKANGMDKADAKTALHKEDRRRTAYYRAYNRSWGKASGYYMTVDATGRTADETADSILSYIAESAKLPKLVKCSIA